jgi:hypothetical protein
MKSMKKEIRIVVIACILLGFGCSALSQGKAFTYQGRGRPSQSLRLAAWPL